MKISYPHFKVLPPRWSLIGHRGIASLAPENTLAGLQKAHQLGIDWIECDVQLTKEGALVVFHDTTLERTTNGTGVVYEQSTAYLKSLDAGSWFHPSFQDQKIPFLEDFLDEMAKFKLQLNIELKCPQNLSSEYEAKFVHDFANLLKSKKFFHNYAPLVSSFYWPILYSLREILPEVPLGFLSEKWPHSQIKKIAALQNVALHCSLPAATKTLFVQAKQYQLPVLVYTVNDYRKAKRLLNLGAFALFSDRPQDLNHS